MGRHFFFTGFLALTLSGAAGVACTTETTVVKKSSAATEPDGPEKGPEDGAKSPASMKPIKSAIDPAIVAKLKSAGLDVEALPESLDSIVEDKQKRSAVMTSFTLALGVECEGCHASTGGKTDFKAETPEKKIAAKMWSSFVQGLKMADGKAIFCDSCHQGTAKFLDRTDEDALRTWMKQNFVGKLARRDGAEHGCATCHGNPFKGDFLDE